MDLIEQNKKFFKNTIITNEKPSVAIRKIMFNNNYIKFVK